MTELLALLQEHGPAAGGIAAALWAGWKARNAEKHAKPTGNGFAEKVLTKLDTLDSRTERTEEKIDEHIQDHAKAHLRAS